MYKIQILMTTYNLEKYDETAIMSVVNQKTTYKYKLMVVDDCSTDSTFEIVEKLKNRFPDLIEAYRNEANKGSLASSNFLFNKIDAEYYSFLDGDDFWNDENYIQEGIAFLDNNSAFSMYGGNTILLNSNGDKQFLIRPNKTNKQYDLEDQIKDRMPFVHTSSIIARNILFKEGLPKVFKEKENTFENCALRGEDFRRIHNLVFGPIYVSKKIRSTYRIHDQGMWQGSSLFKRKVETAIQDNFLKKYFSSAGKDELSRYYKRRFKCSFNELSLHILFNKESLCAKKSEKDIQLLCSLLSDIQSGNLSSKTTFLDKVKRKIISFMLNH